MFGLAGTYGPNAGEPRQQRVARKLSLLASLLRNRLGRLRPTVCDLQSRLIVKHLPNEILRTSNLLGKLAA
ncbi:MAG: hypothetical protein K0Q60_1537 [Microvirga sp.]|jgi:hypothetical protein|nr:hypothetical protein [Microvirga sp.]